jgi:hypothetical protein
LPIAFDNWVVVGQTLDKKTQKPDLNPLQVPISTARQTVRSNNSNIHVYILGFNSYEYQQVQPTGNYKRGHESASNVTDGA